MLGIPNLLATRRGRLGAFFLLYITEGIPLGFAAIAVATELRRRGVGPAEVGALVASFYLPLAFKWAAGSCALRGDPAGAQQFGRHPGRGHRFARREHAAGGGTRPREWPHVRGGLD